MGLLSSLKSVGSSIVKTAYEKVLDPFTTTLAHPIQVATAIVSSKSTVKEVIQKTTSESKGQQITEVLLTGATLAGVAGAAKTIATKGVVAAAKALIPTTTKGKIVGAATALVTVPAVINNPTLVTKAANVATSTPEKLIAAGADLGELTKEPSVKKVVEYVKDNPEVVGAAAAAAALVGAKYLLPAAINELTDKDKPLPTTPEIPKNTTTQSLPTTPATKNKEFGLSEIDNNKTLSSNPIVTGTPVTPQTTNLTTTKTRKPTKYKRKPVLPTTVNQRVNVIVQNKNTNVGIKRYLNRRMLV